MSNSIGLPRVLLLVVCAAPPASQIDELVRMLRADSWDVHVIATPAALSWIDVELLAAHTGHPVQSEPRRPGEPKSLPKGSALVVAPATFNTINKWASGINDTLAMGVLNEALGRRIPIVVAPYVKATLANHPVFERNLALLGETGVSLTAVEGLRPQSENQPFRWEVVQWELSRIMRAEGYTASP
jgi:phosphopantothenoylcysteine decarboxylase